MKTDMSPQAITARLKQTSELRRLCVALAADRLRSHKQTPTNKAVRAAPRHRLGPPHSRSSA